MANKNLSPAINAALDGQEGKDGIDLSKLPAGSSFSFRTKNSLYTIVKVEDKGRYKIKGGNFFPDWTICAIPGSTWGGSMLKMNWIGIDMFVEIVPLEGPHKSGGTITTSAVRGLVYDDGSKSTN